MITPAQIHAARALIGWSKDQLAERAGVSKSTVARLQVAGNIAATGGYASTRDKLVAALEGAGVMFIAANGGGVGVRLRNTAKQVESAQPVYSASRIQDGREVAEWLGRGVDDQDAANRLAVHLKSKLDKNLPQYRLDDRVTLLRPDGQVVSVESARDRVGQMLRGLENDQP